MGRIPEGINPEAAARLNREQQDRQHLHEWYATCVRYVVLGNAGGAIATLSFIGSSLASGGRFPLAIVPLTLFVLGAVIGGIVSLGQLWRLWFADVEDIAKHAIKSTWATNIGRWVEPKTGAVLLASSGCFVVAAAFGIVALLIALNTPALKCLTAI